MQWRCSILFLACIIETLCEPIRRLHRVMFIENNKRFQSHHLSRLLFYAVVSRYTDFRVNEVMPSGEVVRLTSILPITKIEKAEPAAEEQQPGDSSQLAQAEPSAAAPLGACGLHACKSTIKPSCGPQPHHSQCYGGYTWRYDVQDHTLADAVPNSCQNLGRFTCLRQGMALSADLISHSQHHCL